MGSLTPGATYIYENDGVNIYAREFGSTQRRIIGTVLPNRQQQQAEDDLWRQIRDSATHDPALKHALDQVLVIYRLKHCHG
jgi:hypothetical protein